jgi:hypothetical protein
MNFLNALGSKVSSTFHGLGQKAGPVYNIARKGLSTGLEIGKGLQTIVKNPLVQTVSEFLPTPARVAFKAGEKILEKGISYGEALNKALDTGEDIARRVRKQQTAALPQSVVKTPIDIIKDPRIPTILPSSGTSKGIPVKELPKGALF